MLYETSHDTMSHFVTCGIYSGGMAGMWIPQGQKGSSPCPFCFVFITLDPKSWGWPGPPPSRQYVQGLAKGHKEWPGAKFTTSSPQYYRGRSTECLS